jgi:hypothetical protein
MARRIDVAVKDKCYALLFKIDTLERKLESSKKVCPIQGYLAHKKLRPPWTPQQDYA